MTLLAQLGAVCDACAAYNEPGVAACSSCDRGLEVVAWLQAPAPAAASSAAPPTRTPGPAASLVRTPGPVAPLRPPPLRPPGPPPRGLAGPTQPATSRAIKPPPAPIVRCPGCSRTHPAAVAFCPSCGLKVGGPAAAPAKPPANPLLPGQLRLVLLRGLGPAGSAFPLANAVTEAGRAASVAFPADDTLPSKAASFRFRDGRLFVRDEGSGTCLFVRLRHPEVLQPGELFAVGDQLLRFCGRVPAPPAESGATLHHGSPAPRGQLLLRLETIHLGSVAGRSYVRGAPFQLGRALGDVLFPDDPFVSSRHCELDVDPAGALLRDLGSSNGTFLRIPPGADRELLPGDTIRLGRNILRIEAVP